MGIFEKDIGELMQKYDNLKDYEYEEQEKIVNEVRRRKLKTEEEINEYRNSIAIESDIEDFKEDMQEIDNNEILRMYENLNLYYREIREILVKLIIEKELKTEQEIKEKLEKKTEERENFINSIPNLNEEEIDIVWEDMYYYFEEVISVVFNEKRKNMWKQGIIFEQEKGKKEVQKKSEEIEYEKMEEREQEEVAEEPEIFMLNGVQVSHEIIEKRNKIRRVGLFVGITLLYYILIYFKSGIEKITADFFSLQNVSIILIIYVFSNIFGLILFKSTKEQRRYGVLINSILLVVTIMSSAMANVDLEYIKEKFLLASDTPNAEVLEAATEEAVYDTENEKELSEEEKKEIIEKYKTDKMKEIENKIKKLSEKIDKNSKDSELYFEKGELYKKLFKKEKAVEDYTKAIELNENKAKYFIARAYSYPDNEYAGDEYRYERGIEFDIDEYGNEEKDKKEDNGFGETKYVGFGYGDSENSNFDYELESREEFENSKDNFKNNYIQITGKNADRDLAMALELSNTSRIYAAKGNLYRRTGKEILAVKNYKRAVEKDSENIDAYEGLMESYMDIGFFGVAEKYCDGFIKKFPNSYKGYVIKADIYKSENELGASIEICNEGIKKFPKCSELYKKIGKIKMELGRYKEAIIDFDMVIKLESDKKTVAETYFDKGICYEKIRDFDNALTFYNKAVEENMKDSNDFTKELSASIYEKLEEVYGINNDIENKEKCEKIRKELEIYKQLITGEVEIK